MTDEEIRSIARKYTRSLGDHWCNEDGIPEDLIVDFARDLLNINNTDISYKLCSGQLPVLT